MKSVSLFASEYNLQILGGGKHLRKAVDSLKEVWNSVTEKFSVYIILGYTFMLERDKLYNGEFGYDNEVMIKALKWKYDKDAVSHNFYISPRENNKSYESVAYRMGLIYNEYVESLPLTIDRPDVLDLDKYIPMGDVYKMQIGVMEEKVNDDNDYSSIEESLNEAA